VLEKYLASIEGPTLTQKAMDATPRSALSEQVTVKPAFTGAKKRNRSAKMVAQARSKLAVRRLVDQLRQGLNNLILGVINVLQGVQEQVVHRFDVFAEQPHVTTPLALQAYSWPLAVGEFHRPSLAPS
jgi:hypothetical protein